VTVVAFAKPIVASVTAAAITNPNISFVFIILLIDLNARNLAPNLHKSPAMPMPKCNSLESLMIFDQSGGESVNRQNTFQRKENRSASC
jgi:hypothetical protein